MSWRETHEPVPQRARPGRHCRLRVEACFGERILLPRRRRRPWLFVKAGGPSRAAGVVAFVHFEIETRAFRVTLWRWPTASELEGWLSA